MRMEKQTISFRLPSDRLAALDALADTLDRDRTYLLSEAIDAYLETQQWHLQQIQTGLEEADSGHLLSHAKVKAMTAKWRRRK